MVAAFSFFPLPFSLPLEMRFCRLGWTGDDRDDGGGRLGEMIFQIYIGLEAGGWEVAGLFFTALVVFFLLSCFRSPGSSVVMQTTD